MYGMTFILEDRRCFTITGLKEPLRFPSPIHYVVVTGRVHWERVLETEDMGTAEYILYSDGVFIWDHSVQRLTDLLGSLKYIHLHAAWGNKIISFIVMTIHEAGVHETFWINIKRGLWFTILDMWFYHLPLALSTENDLGAYLQTSTYPYLTGSLLLPFIKMYFLLLSVCLYWGNSSKDTKERKEEKKWT